MVVVYGTVCLDRLRQVPFLPSTGAYVEIESDRSALGGEGANTAAALRSWGDEIQLVGNSLGRGVISDQTRQLLHDCHLEDALIPDRDHDGPYCDIFITPGGERTMMGWGFAPMADRHGLDLLPILPGAWLTLDDNHGEAAREALRMGRHGGMRLYSLDFVREDEPLSPDVIWQGSTVWTGTGGNPKATEAWMKDWHDQYGCLMIMTEGEHGLWVMTQGGELRHLPAFTAPQLVDATGAGDAFRAGMLHGLSRDWPFGLCLAFASTTGALACGRVGGAANAPTLQAIEGLMLQHAGLVEIYRALDDVVIPGG
jgi:sugar/nucleoside kinase (ribokinase family)